VSVPQGYGQEGVITLNVAPRAVHAWQTTPTGWHFDARFGGQSVSVVVPFDAIVAIYAKETGQGLFVAPDPSMGVVVWGSEVSPKPPATAPKTETTGGLRVIKGKRSS
jgi:stringent starvation protein B